MKRHTRRSFLKHATVAGIGAGWAISGTKASGKILGANDTIHVGVAGIHGRGQEHMKQFAGIDGVQVTYLIDPDSRLHKSRAERIKQMAGNTPTCVQDIRRALDDKDLDVVTVATCNHWHSLITIWACQAGKDVYVEKPCSHNIFEGRKCVEAAEKYSRIVQHGTQSRASSAWAKTVAAIASGKYGKLLVSKGFASKPRWSIGFKENKQPPPELDYNIWLGPAQEMPYNENLVHYNWHWNWATGCGEIGNQGVHQMDIARWGIPGATLPKRVLSMGGRWVNSTEGKPPYTDQGQTPNMQVTVFDYGDVLMIFEVAGLCGKTIVPGGKAPPRKVTNEFYTTEGMLSDGKFYPKGSGQGQPLDVEIEMQPGSIFQNFIDCVRSRKRENLDADISVAHLSAAHCHLGNISYRVGSQVAGTTVPPAFTDNDEVRKSCDAVKQGLKDALGIDLAKTTYQLGALLEFDPQKEQFIGNDQANQLLTRDYRKPFVVPEQV